MIVYFALLSGVEKVDTNTWLLDETSKRILQQTAQRSYATLNALDAAYMLARECGCYLQLIGDGIQLISYSKLQSAEVSGTLRFYDHQGELGPSNGQYPILTVTSDSKAIFLDMRSRELAVESIRQDQARAAAEKAKAEADKAASASAKTQSGYKKPQGKKTAPAADTRGDTPEKPPPKDALLHQMEELMMEHARVGYHLTVETIGFPDVIPGMKLNVVGVSKRIDGIYAVFNVKHMISSSGFTTSLELRSNFADLTNDIKTTNNTAIKDDSTPPPEPPAKPADSTATGQQDKKPPKKESGSKPRRGGKR
jgi:hypothetical protein